MVNVFSSFWAWLEAVMSWFFPPSMLNDVFLGQIILLIQFCFGCFMLFKMIIEPILILFDVTGKYVYGGVSK